MRLLSPITSAFAPGFRRRLTVAFLTVILVVALIIPVALSTLSSIRASTREARAAALTLDSVSRLQRSIADMRVSARDYVDSGTTADRNQLATDLNSLTDEVHCIRESSGCLRGHTYSALPDSEREQWSSLIGRAGKARDGLAASVANGRGRSGLASFDQRMRGEVEQPADALAGKVRERQRAGEDAIDRMIVSTTGTLVLVLLAAIVLATALAYAVPRSLLRRLQLLRTTAHQLASGDLSARAIETAGGVDEVSDLLRDFNIMARSMQARSEENHLLQLQLQQALMTEQERATRDPLTSLRNHRYFHESLRAELNRCGRSGGHVTIAVLDLDNFKDVNDNFGHQEGDGVLLRTTAGIIEQLRPYDLACRLGGEEFGIILPDTTPEQAVVVLERIAMHIRECGPEGRRLTFSGGVAMFPTHAADPAELFQRADEAAYHSKNNGKAHVTIYDPRVVQEMNSEVQLERRSREAVLATTTTLASAVDAKDPYSRHHSPLTAVYAATIARALNLDDETVKLIYRAALLHDVGKIGVSDDVLLKPGPLTADEWAQIRLHPELSFRILEGASEPAVATWARHHHEHWDGTGYPLGISGEDIPLGSRIILVAEAFESMTSDRVYRRALPVEEALRELHAGSGTQFDPVVADLMARLVRGGVFESVREGYGLAPLYPPGATSPAELPPRNVGLDDAPGQQAA